MTLSDLRRVFAGRVVLAAFALLVGPVVVGALDNDLMTPLALPGYLVFMTGSSIGSYLFPNFALWVFWAPFLAGGYVLAVMLGGTYRALTR